MTKRLLAVVMTAIALLFVVQIGMENLFTQRLSEMVPTLLETDSTAGVRDFPEKAQKPAQEPQGDIAEIFAIFGVDQESGDLGRSDCMLLCSISEDGTVRLCSLARDTLVTMPMSGEQTKLCHAYAYGGPEYAIQTINENYGLGIKKYVSVNFTGMQQLVDQVGGVPMLLTQDEWTYLGLPEPYLGKTRLSGEKALAYSRIRALDSDEIRTGRQRKILSALVTELRQQPISALPGQIGTGIKMCRTNLKVGEILTLSRSVLMSGAQPEGITLPGDQIAYWSGTRADGGWYYVYNLTEAGEIVRNYLYGKEKTENNSCIRVSGVIK